MCKTESDKLFFTDIELALAYCQLLVKKIAKPRRRRILEIVHGNPLCLASEIAKIYLKQYKEPISPSTLDGHLKELVYYGLCEARFAGKRKTYVTTGLVSQLCHLAEIFKSSQRAAMFIELSKQMKR
ncbi:MAG TPA: winged helix-turn-helix domain-containing protein [Candidatus Paceibacterota bacterium]|nr:winged helix-turn-helix domain-containing protein [Candidatus Pacearchaeota archaeon]HRZ51531.1 winged helix-turn-helix domain-containing protein [Candidatus Paceibacterota bacterium]HSA37253.1 winged helix-turn-helix domain-containing protein [Candidatus Paceibacterota bacterium]